MAPSSAAKQKPRPVNWFWTIGCVKRRGVPKSQIEGAYERSYHLATRHDGKFLGIARWATTGTTLGDTPGILVESVLHQRIVQTPAEAIAFLVKHGTAQVIAEEVVEDGLVKFDTEISDFRQHATGKYDVDWYTWRARKLPLPQPTRRGGVFSTALCRTQRSPWRHVVAFEGSEEFRWLPALCGMRPTAGSGGFRESRGEIITCKVCTLVWERMVAKRKPVVPEVVRARLTPTVH